ncbi:MAG TPA: PRC-barrel domain-containing protein [Longimicrobium sp.]|nr:PRC-barrel domain-containing protein [Longimicrobium sp.]
MANNDMDRVVPLGQLDDFKVAEGEPDVRGWEVLASDGRKIGEVDELLVDTAAMKVRYLDVDVDDGIIAGGADRHVLIPIGYARLQEDRDCVMVDALAAADLGGMPSYDQGPLTRDFETSVRENFSARRGTASTTELAGGSGMMDTAGLDNTPGTGTGLGMTGMASDAFGGLYDTDPGMRASTPDADSLRSTGASAGLTSSADDGLRAGERTGAGSQGPTGGMSASTSSAGPGALNEGADELGYDRDAVEMRGDASHRAGLSGSDYQHNADEDFYASDAFDDARFYGSRRPGGSPDTSSRGNFGLSGGTGGAAEVDPLSGSGLPRDGATLHGSSTGDVGTDRDETSRLAREAGERLREDRDNRGVGGTGNL